MPPKPSLRKPVDKTMHLRIRAAKRRASDDSSTDGSEESSHKKVRESPPEPKSTPLGPAPTDDPRPRAPIATKTPRSRRILVPNTPPRRTRADPYTFPASGVPAPITLDVTEAELTDLDPESTYRRLLAYWERDYTPQVHLATHVIPTKEDSCWLKPDQVYAALASVLYARPDLHSIVDMTAVRTYTEASNYAASDFDLGALADFKRTDEHNALAIEQRLSWPAIGGSRLILPWTQEGHFVILVIEPHEQCGLFMSWRLTYYDSYPGTWRPEINAKIIKGVRQLLSDLGWFTRWRIDSDLLWEEGMEEVVAQYQKGATCGVHTAMNGWALALGLEINIDFDAGDMLQRRDNEQWYYFSEEAAHMMNLASLGKMNPATICLFFKTWKFITGESVLPREKAFERTVDVASEQGRCDEVYREMVVRAESEFVAMKDKSLSPVMS